MNLIVKKITGKHWIFIAATLLLAALSGSVFAQAQENNPAGKTISQKRFERLSKKKNTAVLDVRTSDEFKEGHIPNALQIDVLKKEEFKAQVTSLDKKKKYLIYCRSGKRSKTAMTLMKEMGFTKLLDLDGGFTNWKGEKEQ
jgi:rhodanese-related sulfurtransferase